MFPGEKKRTPCKQRVKPWCLANKIFRPGIIFRSRRNIFIRLEIKRNLLTGSKCRRRCQADPLRTFRPGRKIQFSFKTDRNLCPVIPDKKYHYSCKFIKKKNKIKIIFSFFEHRKGKYFEICLYMCSLVYNSIRKKKKKYNKNNPISVKARPVEIFRVAVKPHRVHITYTR